jgi:hypothetical protein
MAKKTDYYPLATADESVCIVRNILDGEFDSERAFETLARVQVSVVMNNVVIEISRHNDDVGPISVVWL